MTAKACVDFTLDGRQVSAEIDVGTTLADFLAGGCAKPGVRVACDQAVCGVCTVLVDDQPVSSCATLAFRVDGTRVDTVHGLDDRRRLSRLQRAFLDAQAFQCGFCTSGQLMLAEALLRAKPNPTRDEIAGWMDANLCRCTGYSRIVDAVHAASREAAS